MKLADDFQLGELRHVSKINVSCKQGGALEMTGGAVFLILRCGFRMEKIDAKRKGKKNKQKKQVEYSSIMFNHRHHVHIMESCGDCQ